MHGYCNNCAFMHNFTFTDVNFFLDQNVHIYFTFTDASTLLGLRCNRLYTNIDPWLCSAASAIYSLLQTTKQTQKKKKKKKKKPSHK